MIIELKNADFSANNIGQISVPVMYNDFTKAIFDKCTRYTLGSKQSKAVNKFVKVLDNLGMLDHLSFFNAPWLSANKEQATYDFANSYQMTNDGFTFENGVLTGSNYKATNLNSPIPLKNIIGVVADKAEDATENTFFKGNDACAMFGYCDYAILGDSFNLYKGLTKYGLTDSSKLLVVKNTTITLTNKDDVEINGETSTIMSNTDSLNIQGNYDLYGVYDNNAQTIAFACDGSVTLTSDQTTTLVYAMNELENALKE